MEIGPGEPSVNVGSETEEGKPNHHFIEQKNQSADSIDMHEIHVETV